MDPSSNLTAAPLELHAERARAARWLAPIPGLARAGVDATYDEAFAELQALIAGLESPTAAPPDWQRVRLVAEEILLARSKDLRVAGCLALSLFELEGLPGLTLGTWLLTDLCEQFWEDMWPSLARLRGRTNGLGWFVRCVGTRLTQRSPHAPELELRELEAALRTFGSSVLPRFGGAGPSLRMLTDFVKRCRAEPPHDALPKKTAHPSAAETLPQSPSAGETPISPPDPLSSPHEIPPAPPTEASSLLPYLRSLGKRLVEISQGLRTANTADPEAYRLLRQGVWLHLASAPPRDAKARTKIPAPPKRVVDTLGALLAAQKWDALLVQAEGSLPAFPLWLDLHWYSAQALRGLSAGHEAAREALEREVRAFVARLPELLDACFQDGSTLASPAARSWLRLEHPPEPVAQAHGACSEEGLCTAHQALVSAVTREGLLEVQAAIEARRGERERFLCRLDLARGLAAAGRDVAALALYRGLTKDVEDFHLDRWEPALAARALTAHLEAFRGHESPSGVVTKEVSDLYLRLARLAPGALI